MVREQCEVAVQVYVCASASVLRVCNSCEDSPTGTTACVWTSSVQQGSESVISSRFRVSVSVRGSDLCESHV